MRWRLIGWWRIAAGAVALCLLVAGVVALDRLAPPDLTRYHALSRTLEDRDGRLLRVRLSPDGAIRLRTGAAEVDPIYLDMLIAYEDKRFWTHPGVDPLAMARAVWQAVSNGRVISGGSTLTMQVARLLEPRERTVWAKLVECARAVQLERRYAKHEILDMYLTLAPFGGPLEGVRAASHAYFAKEPLSLTPAEAALLVALPQQPSRLRPDRHAERARVARDKILARTLARWDPDAAETARLAPVPARRVDVPLTAPHLADRLFTQTEGVSVASTVDRTLQRSLTDLARRHERASGTDTGAAILVIENATRAVRAYVGGGDYLSVARRGGVDMVSARRSPGSALKPFVYGLAMEERLVHPATLISDRPRSFAGYAPRNFDGRSLGDVSMADALRLSLNVPAVAVLSALGPMSLFSRFERVGVDAVLPAGAEAPGLAVAVGGLAMTLADVAALYAALAEDGTYRPLRFRREVERHPGAPKLMSAEAARAVTDILRTGALPRGHANRLLGKRPFAVAFKTGTSYGYRDAWAFGYTPSHTIGVWRGRVDGTPSPGESGRKAALPMLFDAFAAVAGWAGQDFQVWSETPRVPATAPANLARLTLPGENAGSADPLELHFPLDGMVLELQRSGDGLSPVPLEAMGGDGKLTWLVDGAPLPVRRGRPVVWRPRGAGGAEVTVIDRAGAARTARVWIEVP
jgi:penicillin-binding protein 1C